MNQVKENSGQNRENMNCNLCDNRDHIPECNIIKERKFDFKRILISGISTLLLSFVFSFLLLYKSMSSLEGRWIRLPDDNVMANGMIIEIKNEGGMYIGEVVAIDDGTQMPIGTIKWQQFQKDALDVFVFNDLSFSFSPKDREYDTSYGLISFSGKKLTIYSSGSRVGSHQVWIKE